jgi:hypothetical protein
MEKIISKTPEIEVTPVTVNGSVEKLPLMTQPIARVHPMAYSQSANSFSNMSRYSSNIISETGLAGITTKSVLSKEDAQEIMENANIAISIHQLVKKKKKKLAKKIPQLRGLSS